MRIAVTFCNQVLTPQFGLAVVDDSTAKWVSLPLVDDAYGATGMTLDGDRLIVSLQQRGRQSTLVSFDHRWTATTVAVDQAHDVHDIHSTCDGMLVTSTGNDRLYRDDEVIFQASELGRDEYHLNGVAADASRVLLTMFGAKRGRRWSDTTAGCVAQLDGEPVIEDLHHPHSPRLADGQLWVCESGKGRLVVEERGRKAMMEIGGYVRGMWVGPDVVVVGESSLRRRSRSEGTTNSIDDGTLQATASGLILIDRHRLTVLDRWDLTALGGEIFDVFDASEFDMPYGPSATTARCLALLDHIAQLDGN